MPKPYLTNNVVEALEVIKEFVSEQKTSKCSASQVRESDSWAFSVNPANDRQRYYDNNMKALQNILTGHTVNLASGKTVRGIKV